MTALLDMARAAGFEAAAPLRAEQLVFRPEVREMCRADRCRSYGRNWCCPPACPSLEDMARRMADYGDGVLVETVGAAAAPPAPIPTRPAAFRRSASRPWRHTACW